MRRNFCKTSILGKRQDLAPGEMEGTTGRGSEKSVTEAGLEWWAE